MAERDYPVGHPAAVDYAGQKYTGPRAPWQDDFPEDHPARGGANTNATDTPDGQRAFLDDLAAAVQDRAAEGGSAVSLAASHPKFILDGLRRQEALDYLAKRGYTPGGSEELLTKYSVDDVLADRDSATH